MKLPPAIIRFRIKEEGSHRFRIWLPVFLLWPLLLVLLGLALIGTLIADAILLVSGTRYHRYTLLVLGSVGLLSEIKGTRIYVQSPDTFVDLDIY